MPKECALKFEIGIYSKFKKILWSSEILYITPTNGRNTKCTVKNPYTPPNPKPAFTPAVGITEDAKSGSHLKSA